MIEILTHSDSELSNSTEDGESDSKLDETGTATLDCVWNFFTRKRILNLMIDNFFGIICKDIIFTEWNNKLTIDCGYTSQAVFSLSLQAIAASAVAAATWV